MEAWGWLGGGGERGGVGFEGDSHFLSEEYHHLLAMRGPVLCDFLSPLVGMEVSVTAACVSFIGVCCHSSVFPLRLECLSRVYLHSPSLILFIFCLL